MIAYEVKLADGQVVWMAGRDHEHAMARAVDLYGSDAVAWRVTSAQGSVSVLGDAARIIG